MLSGQDSRLAHAWQNLQLLALNLAFLPLDTFILAFSYFAGVIFYFKSTAHRYHVRGTNTPYLQPRTILVTGVGMTKGLALARLFYVAGHNVIGADFESTLVPSASGHVSKSIKAFHRLQKPDGTNEGSARYAQSILNIIRKEKVDLWVSCSGVASAVEDGQAKEMIELVTNCKAVQFDIATTKKLHEKHTFIEHTQSLGLAIPETHTVTSKSEVAKVLEQAQTGRKFIMKFIGTDDTVRGDMTLLPFSSHAATQAHISRLQISKDRPWILQQYIKGPEYCTHSLVVRGEVKAFVACPSAELLMHYEAIPLDSALSRDMLRFTQEFAAEGGEDFTGHLSFDFLVDAEDAEAAQQDPSKHVTLYPIECNPRAHTAVCLFNDTPEMISKGYMSLLESLEGRGNKKAQVNGATPTSPVYPRSPAKYYWIGHDLVELVILPVLSLMLLQGATLFEVYNSIMRFIEHLIWWRDGTFEIWDPLPAWWLYHVSWPYQFLTALLSGNKWSRINVSTMKVFGC